MVRTPYTKPSSLPIRTLHNPSIILGLGAPASVCSATPTAPLSQDMKPRTEVAYAGWFRGPANRLELQLGPKRPYKHKAPNMV